jgi:maltose alpha-D-glucosyltransferase / alpha-amylase
MTSGISEQLKNDIKSSLKSVYKTDKLNKIFENVLKIINEAKLKRSVSLEKDDLTRDSSWYKDEIVYMFYAEHFGVKNKNVTNTFKDLKKMLPYLKDLGVTIIYILPFMESPMGDGGFDVSDPRRIRSDLGGNDEFIQFMKELKDYGLKVQVDLVLNHFSDQHNWFKDILKGDLSKLDYFLFLKEPPVYEKRNDDQKGIIIIYTEENGKKSPRRLIFSDNCENHYIKRTIEGKDYYFYHTFYPFQLDINWKNPMVLYYVLETIACWSNIGVDIFRLDAIPFLIKEEGKDAENNPKTHDIIRILSAFIQAIGSRSVLLAEACQCPKDIFPYFGKERTFDINENIKLTRTDEVQLAYDFPGMNAIWANLITESNEHFWNAYKEVAAILCSTTWVEFLRVHDELTLEMVDTDVRKLIYNSLISKGAEFRKGLGVSGRLANFLDNKIEKINLAFAILLSLPGLPVIYYGDEIGAQNNLEYACIAAKNRKKVLEKLDKSLKISSFDSRDINRGPILENDLYNSMKDGENISNLIYKTVRNLIKIRKDMSALRRGTLTKIKSDKKEIFSYLRDSGDQQIIVVNNLSGVKSKILLTLSNNSFNKIVKTTDLINLINGEKIKICLESNKLILYLKPYQTIWLNVP